MKYVLGLLVISFFGLSALSYNEYAKPSQVFKIQAITLGMPIASGTGFLSSYKGKTIILTAGHVCDMAFDGYVIIPNRGKREIAKRLPFIDACVINAKPEDGSNGYGLDSMSHKLNEPVVVHGYPLGIGPIESSGTLYDTVPSFEGPLFQITNIVNHGNSGGPALGPQGLLGIVVSMSVEPRLTQIVPAQSVVAVLDLIKWQ